MPRIDPIRLLSCLKPLLNLSTGGIRSDKEVDKVFVLMTKFSKKLVSKCTYINILRATAADVLNLFMERGGWDMIYNWTKEAKEYNNHVLLNEILNLLLVTPASVSRLRTNSLPKEVKQISNKWDSEQTKTLAERLVANWIAIARNEDSGQVTTATPPGSSSAIQQTVISSSLVTQPQSTTAPYEMQNLGQLPLVDDNSSINANLASDNTYESENPQTLDMDVDSFDFTEMMDFNPDVFTKTVANIDLHLSDLNNDGDANKTTQIFNNMNNEHSIIQQQQQPQLQQQQLQQQPQQHHPAALTPGTQTLVIQNNTVPMVAASSSPTVPRIVIKTSGGQRTVVSATDGTGQLAQTTTKERLCYVTHNGQKFLMSLRVADEEELAKLDHAPATAVIVPPPSAVVAGTGGAATTTNNSAEAITQDQQVTSSSIPSTPDSSNNIIIAEGKRKRPRKDPSIAALRIIEPHTIGATPANNQAIGNNNSNDPKVLKTYSKKTNAELTAQASDPATAITAASLEKDGAKAKSSSSKSSSSTNKSSSSPSSSSSSSKRSSSKSSSSAHSSKSSAAAAAAAAEQERAEKLRRQVKESKRKLKERERESKKHDKKKSENDKQKQKDDETLKEVYGASTSASPSTSLKIPKKPKPSFAELIGVPGAGEETKKEKITKEKQSESEKKKSSKDAALKDVSPPKDEDVKDTTGLGAFSRPESKEIGPAKERRHQVKIYTSSKSKNMDLLETMTKGSKIKSKEEAPAKAESKSPTEKSSGGLSFEDALSGGASSAIKPAKRPSIDSASKTGETKKPKLDDSASKKDSKEKSSKESSSSKDKKDESKRSKEKESSSKSSSDKSKKSGGIQESSLFMDALTTATRGPSKLKRKRRISEHKEAVISVVSNNSLQGKSDGANHSPAEKIATPVFNFYRETLNDDDDEAPKSSEEAVNVSSSDNTTANTSTETPPTTEPTGEPQSDVVDDFAAEEWEGKLKSCLCIHRPKGKPKKSVKWREEDELKEFHFFEMDETERINVTKQHKNFTEMSQMEKSEERLCVRKKFAGEAPAEERLTWGKLRPIDPESLASQPEVPINSQEKRIQEERERGILEVFYFPGTILPEHPSEQDVMNFDPVIGHIPKVIPSEDIPILTKVSDFRSTPWPRPLSSKSDHPHTAFTAKMLPSRPPPIIPMISPEPGPSVIPAPVPNPDPANAFVNAFNAVASHNTFDLNNPWTQSQNPFDPNLQANDPWKIAQEAQGFGSFPPVVPPNNLAAGANAFANPFPFGFSFTGAPPQVNALPNLAQMPPNNFVNPGFLPNANQFNPVPNPVMGRDDGMPHNNNNNNGNNRNNQGRPRDVDYRDMRRNNDRDRDRGDRDSRNRSGRGDRDRDRDRGDRDMRDRGRDNNRDRFDKDKDFRGGHDRRRPGGGRRGITCNYFVKGFCREGNKCAYLHPGVNGPNEGGNSSNNNNSTTTTSSSNHNPRGHKPSPPPSTSNNNHYEDRRRSPPSSSSRDNSNSNNGPSSPPPQSSSSSSSHIRDIPEIESPTPEDDISDRFILPPSSPTNEPAFGGAEAVKVIPTFTDEDWG